MKSVFAGVLLLCVFIFDAKSQNEFDVLRLDYHENRCDNKIADGCYNICIAYFMGYGYKIDRVKSRKYIERAHELEPSNVLFISTIARMSYYDYKVNGNAKDMNEALQFFNKACDYNDSNSCNMLGYIYEVGENDVGVDLSKAKSYFYKSCSLKDVTGCDKIKTSKVK